MSCLTCSNCGFVNLQFLNAIQSSDDLVSQLLRGSRPLLDADHAFIDAEITKLKRLRIWYDAQLQEIELYRKQLKKRESIYAPIRRLPRDILIEIFHSICDSWWQDHQDEDEDEDFERDSLDVTGPLWILGRVCGLWRDTLLTSPASWARYVSVTSPLSKHACEILQTYLKHTGEHPLSLVVICKGANFTEEGEIMSLLVKSCYRWKNVHINIAMHHAHHLESISHLPILQTIDIDILDDDDSDYSSDIFLDAPQLWQATLSSQGIYQIKLPPMITHYSGHITRFKDFQLLSQLPKLRTCHLSSAVSTASMKEPVVMAELYQLFVQDLDILKFLTAPMLQSLTIARGSRESLSSIPVFFHRSGCHLESFSIGMAILEFETSASISDIFSSEACSTISHLKFEFGSVWYNVPNAFASSLIIPNVRHLVLCFGYRYSRNMKTEWHALLDIIHSRCKAGLLKVIEVQFLQTGALYGDGDIKADIRALVGDNLEVRVEQWSPLFLDHQLAFWDPQPPM
ncbi:hypothetical protein EV421DRAFT_2018428 [Armillaria borealis]|uniref:F-box domain-containing protein n=1 Tax=Armillaria borealis TaxID=47425 RepID=A0AA39JP11_9AGAR|nr:hypothetical protein EV421DRAFT_2018428 [Armillaria borealis]